MAKNNPDRLTLQQAKDFYKNAFTPKQRKQINRVIKARKAAYDKLGIAFEGADRYRTFIELVTDMHQGRWAENETETEQEDDSVIYNCRHYDQYVPPRVLGF